MNFKNIYNNLIAPDSNSGKSTTQSHSSKLNSDYQPDQYTYIFKKTEPASKTADHKPEIKIVEITDVDQKYKIADLLQSNSAIVFNLNKLKKDEAKDVSDFVTGASYLAHGKLNNIAENVFLVTPSTFEVEEKTAESVKPATKTRSRRVTKAKSADSKSETKSTVKKPVSDSKSEKTASGKDAKPDLNSEKKITDKKTASESKSARTREEMRKSADK